MFGQKDHYAVLNIPAREEYIDFEATCREAFAEQAMRAARKEAHRGDTDEMIRAQAERKLDTIMARHMEDQAYREAYEALQNPAFAREYYARTLREQEEGVDSPNATTRGLAATLIGGGLLAGALAMDPNAPRTRHEREDRDPETPMTRQENRPERIRLPKVKPFEPLKDVAPRKDRRAEEEEKLESLPPISIPDESLPSRPAPRRELDGPPLEGPRLDAAPQAQAPRQKRGWHAVPPAERRQTLPRPDSDELRLPPGPEEETPGKRWQDTVPPPEGNAPGDQPVKPRPRSKGRTRFA